MPRPAITTNSADDSEGKFKFGPFEIENENIFLMLFGLILGMLVTVQLTRQGWTFFQALPVGCLPLTGFGSWVFLLRQGKPKAYDRDWFSSLLRKGWEPNWKKQPEHPIP